ncbi:MAG: EAL domain-containing protein [Lamprobacter sp.]|uniref:sensor domain-containing protein n=1 Tax=Lamprobacter sp. TaxID=3100796 RepID=UPI002B258AE6|nr:EAL domain-containing protein [Lamprobacter sp.]MEA3641413.1 EAL domain-containing protein [Lamprobacter sp.]
MIANDPTPNSVISSGANTAAEIQDLKRRLAEAEAVLHAIGAGEVDALLVTGRQGGQVLELQGAEHDYRLLVEEMGEGAITLTATGQIYYANRRMAAMLDLSHQLLTGTALAEFISESDRPAYHAWLRTPSPRPQQRLELQLLSASGASIPCHLSLTELPYEQKQGAFCVIATDLSVQKRAEDAVRQSEQRLKSIVEHLPIGVWFLDQHGQISYGNSVAQRIWNCAERFGRDHFRTCDRCSTKAEDGTKLQNCAALRAIFKGETTLNKEVAIQCVDGTQKTILTSAVPIQDGDSNIVGAVVLNTDITERKAAENQIQQLAFFDVLTHLPNRRLLIDRLGHALASIQRTGSIGALLFIDLDHFKDLNDSLGHDMGDQLLKQVAARLVGSVRARDTVARLGGDEFVIVMEDLSDDVEQAAQQTRTVAEKVLAAIAKPYPLGGGQHHVTPSIGATLIDAKDLCVDDLLKRADLAMYQAKDAGRNRFRFFDPQTQIALEQRTELEAHLREGLRNQQFVLHYQAQVDGDGSLIGAEALLRWAHPEHGMLGPDVFIHLAEETGLILPLGEWVLQAACLQLVAWAEDRGSRQRSLAINISARQFRDPNFVEMVRTAVLRYGIEPSLLELELTESLLLEDLDETITKMAALRALGLRFALDDFGTGYSSLAYLKRLPLDTLKIDRSFVDDVTRDANAAAIVRAILALAPKLGLSVIAEGVETEAQRQFLARNGCCAFQGYLFGKPAPAKTLGL